MTSPTDYSSSRFVAFVAMFAAMSTVLDLLLIPSEGVWDSWIFLLSPLVGALIGPIGGFIAIGIGSLAGHLIFFRDAYELLFMFGAPLGALMGGFVYQGKWKPVVAIYSLMLLGYFLEPVSWLLPLWGIWDILAAFCLIIVFSFVSSRNMWPENKTRRDFLNLLFTIIIGLESDILFRVFVLIPGQTYWFFYGLSPEALQLIWLGAGILTPLKVAIATVVGLAIGLPLLRQFPDGLLHSENRVLDD